jgi:hypothetical protein
VEVEGRSEIRGETVDGDMDRVELGCNESNERVRVIESGARRLLMVLVGAGGGCVE